MINREHVPRTCDVAGRADAPQQRARRDSLLAGAHEGAWLGLGSGLGLGLGLGLALGIGLWHG